MVFYVNFISIKLLLKKKNQNHSSLVAFVILSKV